MFRPHISAILLVLALGGTRSRAATPAHTVPTSSWQQVGPENASPYDSDAERQLLEMANADRVQAGLPPLKLDDGMVRAARVHAAEMAVQRKLSHQFGGEAPLFQRLAVYSPLHLKLAGENVAMAANADDAHDALMASPPHRDNLLSSNFNVAGFGVIRSGHMLYVAQDFGSSSPSYSVQQAQELVSENVEQLRAQSKMPRLVRVNDIATQSSACAMAQRDSLGAATAPAGAYMLRYTSMSPENLPSNISKVIAQRGLRTFSAGTCYARTANYPTGAYWVVLVFY